jgi:limonene-1,2-epoxide hydrolase
LNNIERTKAFIAHWEARDLEAMLGAVADDIFYHNIPMAPVESKDALRAFAAPFLAGAARVEWEIHHIAETSEGAVLTERLDHFHMKDGKTISIRVMGTFEFDGRGKLTKWRDYFDLAEFQSQMGG